MNCRCKFKDNKKIYFLWNIIIHIIICKLQFTFLQFSNTILNNCQSLEEIFPLTSLFGLLWADSGRKLIGHISRGPDDDLKIVVWTYLSRLSETVRRLVNLVSPVHLKRLTSVGCAIGKYKYLKQFSSSS